MQLKRKTLLLTFLVTLILHALILFTPKQNNQKNLLSQNNTPLKIRNIKTLGEEKSKIKEFLLTGNPKEEVQKKRKELDLKDLEITPKESTSKKTKAIENLKLSESGIKKFLKKENQFGTSSNKNLTYSKKVRELSPSPLLPRRVMDSNVGVSLEVPKGVKLDELNPEELVFYSFQRRSAIKYVSTFYNKLNQFNLENPHLTFPMTENKTRMAGKITYDKNGNIVRIKVLEWTRPQKLQDFFVSLLQDMTTLPNPPKELIDENNEFSIIYSLLINI